jgi:hypothetical protein
MRVRSLRPAALVLIAAVTAGCTWVRLSEGGEAVRVVDAVEGAGCERIGRVTATSREAVAGVDRSLDKVREELQTLARNEAATLGANAVVATSPIEDGRQNYDALRCSP